MLSNNSFFCLVSSDSPGGYPMPSPDSSGGRPMPSPDSPSGLSVPLPDSPSGLSVPSPDSSGSSVSLPNNDLGCSELSLKIRNNSKSSPSDYGKLFKIFVFVFLKV